MVIEKQMTVDAVLDNLDTVMVFLEETLEEYQCPMKTSMQIAVSFEEIFVNVANYAYGSAVGQCTVAIEIEANKDAYKAIITVTDSGKQFNPLDREDPDITLSADDREIGGLGIFMTKKSMDSVSYKYENNSNILIMEKSW